MPTKTENSPVVTDNVGKVSSICACTILIILPASGVGTRPSYHASAWRIDNPTPHTPHLKPET